VTLDNPSSKKINHLQVILQNQAKRDVDSQALYPAGMPVVHAQVRFFEQRRKKTMY
jgi:hypothetical protein